jgi:hypothetical protein
VLGKNISTIEAEYGGARKFNVMGNFVIFTHNKILLGLLNEGQKKVMACRIYGVVRNAYTEL